MFELFDANFSRDTAEVENMSAEDMIPDIVGLTQFFTEYGGHHSGIDFIG